MTLIQWLLAGGLSFAGATFGASAGGSGLLIVPGLVLLGSPVRDAIVALEVGALGMMAVSSVYFHKSKLVNYSLALPLTALSMIGSGLGAWGLMTTPDATVERLVGFALLFISPLLFFLPVLRQGNADRPVGSTRVLLGCLLFLLVGMWSGFFSAGSHILATAVLVLVLHRSFLESAAITKIEGMGSGVLSSSIFVASGMVPWTLASAVFAGMALGGCLGSRLGIRKGERWVRNLFLLVAVITSLKLLW